MIRRPRTACMLALLLCAAALTTPVRAERTWELAASDWARPRSGESIVGMAPLPAVVRAWSATPDTDIVIRHTGGEEGELWARELRDWLIALGVPGDRIRRVVGGADPHRLQLTLRPSEASE